MCVHDPIGDLLTVIRNASNSGHPTCSASYSNIRLGIVKILHKEGYISSYSLITKNRKKIIELSLKYVNYKPAIVGLNRISKPGRRIYTGYKDTPRVLGGLGISILSTPKGILTDHNARSEKVGGEVMCKVW